VSYRHRYGTAKYTEFVEYSERKAKFLHCAFVFAPKESSWKSGGVYLRIVHDIVAKT